MGEANPNNRGRRRGGLGARRARRPKCDIAHGERRGADASRDRSHAHDRGARRRFPTKGHQRRGGHVSHGAGADRGRKVGAAAHDHEQLRRTIRLRRGRDSLDHDHQAARVGRGQPHRPAPQCNGILGDRGAGVRDRLAPRAQESRRRPQLDLGEIVMRPACKIRGVCVADDGTPEIDAAVFAVALDESPPTPIIGRSGADGSFVFEGLPPESIDSTRPRAARSGSRRILGIRRASRDSRSRRSSKRRRRERRRSSS